VQTGRPHWLIVDEAHHVLPAWVDDPLTWKPGALALVTVGPHKLSPGVAPLVTHVCAAGKDPAGTLEDMAELLSDRAPRAKKRDPPKGEALLWHRGKKRSHLIKLIPA